VQQRGVSCEIGPNAPFAKPIVRNPSRENVRQKQMSRFPVAVSRLEPRKRPRRQGALPPLIGRRIREGQSQEVQWKCLPLSRKNLCYQCRTGLRARSFSLRLLAQTHSDASGGRSWSVDRNRSDLCIRMNWRVACLPSWHCDQTSPRPPKLPPAANFAFIMLH